MAEELVKNIMDEVKSIADDSYLLGIEVSIQYLALLMKNKKCTKAKKEVYEEVMQGLNDLRQEAIELGCANF